MKLMKQINPLYPISLFILLTTTFIACEKEEEHLTAYGDAFVLSTLKDSTIRYSLHLYAYSWYKMKEVIVRRSNDTQETVLDSLDYRYTFANMPDTNQYSLTPPESGAYLFQVVFDNNETYEATDFLDTTLISPPVITKAVFDSTEQVLNLQWEKVCKDCACRVLLKEGETIAFQSEFYNSDQTYFNITPYTSGWAYNKQPAHGDLYHILVIAYLFEPVASAFDLQCVAMNEEHEFTWVNPFSYE